MKKPLIALTLFLLTTPSFADVQYRSGDTPNTTSMIGQLPMYSKAGVMTAVSDTNPLPTSASVAADPLSAKYTAQATGNTSLASIDSKITAVNTGAVVMASGSTTKIADHLGNVFTKSTGGATNGMDIAVATGSAVKLLDATGNALRQTSGSLDTNISRINGAPTSMGVGTSDTGTQRVVLATGSTTKLDANNAVIGSLAANQSVNIAQMNGTTTSMGVGTSDTGTQRVVLATGSTTKLDANNAIIGLVIPTPGTTGGWSSATQSTLSSVVQTVKTTAGTFGGYTFYNPNSSVCFLLVFDATSVANATRTNLDLIMGIPATSAANIEFTNGIKMSNGVYVAASASASTITAPSISMNGSVYYK